MTSSLKTLAARVDVLAERGGANVTETALVVLVTNLTVGAAEELVPLAGAGGWSWTLSDCADEVADASSLSDNFAPYLLTIQKPQDRDTLKVLTNAGFRSLLLSNKTDIVWELVSLDTTFSSMKCVFLPWGRAAFFAAADETKSPRELVREYGSERRVPFDIGYWTLRLGATEELWREPAFCIFAQLSTKNMLLSLATEVKDDGGLFFRGPPHLYLPHPDANTSAELDIVAYNELRAAVVWVYENSKESEQRHILLASELARHGSGSRQTAIFFREVGASALDGARLAYQLSLSDLSREAIKAQADIRKAVADDIAKVAENSRQVATSVVAALTTCIGLIVARMSTTAPVWTLQIISLIVLVYVLISILSGWYYINIQKEMRKTWRARLYRFIPDDDYRFMVSEPADKSEFMFQMVSIVGGLVSFVAFFATIFQLK